MPSYIEQDSQMIVYCSVCKDQSYCRAHEICQYTGSPLESKDVALKPSREAALTAIRTLLAYIGDNPARPGLTDTPARVLAAWETDWGRGYKEAEPDLRMFAGEVSRYNELVIVKDIEVHSMCEHHMAPWYGKATVGYIPNSKGIVGLSKLARIVEHFARRLTVQEKVTEQVADFVEERIAPSVGVVIKATHMCMVTRGVHQPGTMTTTSALRGGLFRDNAARSEFFSLIR